MTTNTQFSTAVAPLIKQLAAGTITEAAFVTAFTAALDPWIGIAAGNSQIALAQIQLVTNWNADQAQFADWLAGTSTGGALHQDGTGTGGGYYPLTNGSGITQWFLSPAGLAANLTGLVFKGSVATIAARDAIASPAVGDTYKVDADGHLYARRTGAWIDVGPAGVQGPPGVKGDKGDPGAGGAPGGVGPANTLAIGTVTTAASGASADAQITGDAPNQHLDLTLPRGLPGPKGDKGDMGPAAWLPVAAFASGIAATPTAPATVVTYAGRTYVAKTAHTTTSSFDPSKWTLLADKGADGSGSGTVTTSGTPAVGHLALWASATELVDGGEVHDAALVAETGQYGDLLGRPDLSVFQLAAAAFPGTWTALGGKPSALIALAGLTPTAGNVIVFTDTGAAELPYGASGANTILQLGPDGKVPASALQTSSGGGLSLAAQSKSADYTLTAADAGKMVEATGTWKLTPYGSAAAGYTVGVSNVGTGVLSIDVGGVTLDGIACAAGALLRVYPGECFLLRKGTGDWETIGRSKRVRALTATASAATSVDLSILADPTIVGAEIAGTVQRGSAGSAPSTLYLQFVPAGGSTLRNPTYAGVKTTGSAVSAIGSQLAADQSTDWRVAIELRLLATSWHGVSEVIDVANGSGHHVHLVSAGPDGGAMGGGKFVPGVGVASNFVLDLFLLRA